MNSVAVLYNLLHILHRSAFLPFFFLLQDMCGACYRILHLKPNIHIGVCERQVDGTMNCGYHATSSLKCHAVSSQASVDEQTELGEPEEGTGQSALAILLGLGSVSNSVNDSAERPDETESRAEERVMKTTDEQCGEGHVVVLEEVA